MTPEEISWLAKVFRKIDMFSSLSIGDMSSLIERMEKKKYSAGEKIIRQGAKGDSFFIVHRGKVKVSVSKLFLFKKNIGELGPEQFFGEMALLSDAPRTATVTAAGDAECFVLFKGEFQNLVKKNPTFSKLIEDLRSKRAQAFKR